MSADSRLLRYCIQELLDISAADYGGHDITRALMAAGIIGFYEHFSILSENDIELLYVPAKTRGQAGYPLSLMDKQDLRAILAFFHDASATKGKRMKMQ